MNKEAEHSVSTTSRTGKIRILIISLNKHHFLRWYSGLSVNSKLANKTFSEIYEYGSCSIQRYLFFGNFLILQIIWSIYNHDWLDWNYTRTNKIIMHESSTSALPFRLYKSYSYHDHFSLLTISSRHVVSCSSSSLSSAFLVNKIRKKLRSWSFQRHIEDISPKYMETWLKHKERKMVDNKSPATSSV